MTDAPYLNCDGCRTTMGRAGCPVHRQNNAVTIAPSTQWSSSEPALTHCPHGLDLRLNPRCYLCRPLDAERERIAPLVEAAREVANLGWKRDIIDYAHAWDKFREAVRVLRKALEAHDD